MIFFFRLVFDFYLRNESFLGRELTLGPKEESCKPDALEAAAPGFQVFAHAAHVNFKEGTGSFMLLSTMDADAE
jgi:hypothetical protein